MALAIDASTPAQFSNATTISITSASFTPPAGAVLLVLYAANGSNALVDTSVTSVTNTGTAATWTRRGRKNINSASTSGAGEPGGVEAWTATAPGGAITVTINGVGSTAGHDKFGKVMVLTGADTSALTNVAAAFSASGLASVALAGCSVGSHVFAVASDWGQKGLGTVGTAQTMIDEYNNTGQISDHTWRTTSTLASAGSQTMNLTAPAAQDFNILAIEIKASGGAAALPPIIVLPPRR